MLRVLYREPSGVKLVGTGTYGTVKCRIGLKEILLNFKYIESCENEQRTGCIKRAYAPRSKKLKSGH